MPELDWLGKNEVVNYHNNVPFKFLVKNKSVLKDDTGNLVISSDNLEALKSLLPYYKGRVKCIYIDPPYNTGNESWEYNDKVNSPIMKEWLGKVVGKDDLNMHDKWLCMMYPRLCLLHELLSPDGVIFISIDDNEQSNLRSIMDEIFGPKNFLSTMVWIPGGVTDNQLEIKIEHEYVLVYCKDISKKSEAISNVISPDVPENSSIYDKEIRNSVVKNGSGNPASEITLPKGFPADIKTTNISKSNISRSFYSEILIKKWISSESKTKHGIKRFPILKDPIIVSNNKLVKPARVFSGWQNANKIEKFIRNGCVPDKNEQNLRFCLTKNGGIDYVKDRSDEGSRLISSIIRDVDNTTNASKQLREMGVRFSYPKPTKLIKFLISMGSKKNDVILDSFAGSGTTAHSVMELNREALGGGGGGYRKFIVIEIEPSIAKEKTIKRLQKVAAEYQRDGLSNAGFTCCTLGTELFDEEGAINNDCTFEDLAHHIFLTETGTAMSKPQRGGLLGVHNGVYIYMIHKNSKTGNVLDFKTLKTMPKIPLKVVYADQCLISDRKLKQLNCTFKQIPYEVET